MFGKEDNIITDDDVGNFVKKLQDEGSKEVIDYVLEEDDELASNSTSTSTRSQNKD